MPFQRPAVEIVGLGLLPAARLPAYRLIKARVHPVSDRGACGTLYPPPPCRRSRRQNDPGISGTSPFFLNHAGVSKPFLYTVSRKPDSRLRSISCRYSPSRPDRATARCDPSRYRTHTRAPAALGQHEVYIIYVSVVFHGAAVLHIVAPELEVRALHRAAELSERKVQGAAALESAAGASELRPAAVVGYRRYAPGSLAQHAHDVRRARLAGKAPAAARTLREGQGSRRPSRGRPL